MKKRGIAIIFGALVLSTAALYAQDSQLPPPSPIEKDLAAKASDVTEVTLGKNMLGFASKFMDGKKQDDAAVKQLVQGLDGIYVRSYEFEKEGAYTMEQVDALRKYFGTSEWTPMVKVRERKGQETTDVMMKMVNGEPRGLFVLAAEPKELTIVLILGPIHMEDLGKLRGLSGLGALGDIDGGATKEKVKEKAKTGGGE